MGLPVWQPSSPDVQKNATTRDPTASSRSAIRRRRSTEIASSSSASSTLAALAATERSLRSPRIRQDTPNAVESSRRRASELARAESSQLRASELREARQNLRRSRQTNELQRRIDRLPDLSRDLPRPFDAIPTRMTLQTRELRSQISQLRELIQQHQAQDARNRARAAPWLEPDQQLHSDDPGNPISALHALRTPLSALSTLLLEVESEFRDPIPQDAEERFRVSIRARYAENPLENPHHDAAATGWNPEMIEDFWEEELSRRLHHEPEGTPLHSTASNVFALREGLGEPTANRNSISTPETRARMTSRQLSRAAVLADNSYTTYRSIHSMDDPEARNRWDPYRTYLSRYRDSHSPSAAASPGGPVHSTSDALRRNWFLPDSLVEARQRREARARTDREQPGWEAWAAIADGPALSPTFPSHSIDSYSRYAPSVPRLVQSPPSYVSAGGIDGLGDRDLSIGPGDNDEAWEIMQATVAPDRTLPSADSSFTSAAASASFSASRSHSTESSVPTSFVDEDEWDRAGECL